jgi:large subunit ribosomal protein L24
MLIRSGDTVEMLTGNSHGTRSRVIKVYRQDGKLLVEGVNRVYKHVRRSQKHPQGGRLSKEMPVQASNAMFVCPACSKATRLGSRFLKDGAKERYCKKCGAGAGEIAPAKAAHATK